MKQIPLTQSKFALVDDADYAGLNRWKWCAVKDRNTYYATRGSRRVAGRKSTIKMHREILNLKKGDGKETDHINGNGLDNRRSNLRICTRQQNHFNRKPEEGASAFKGVCFEKRRNRWKAQIKATNKHKHLGYFLDEIKAAKAYDRAAETFFGEFARLNFPK